MLNIKNKIDTSKPLIPQNNKLMLPANAANLYTFSKSLYWLFFDVKTKKPKIKNPKDSKLTIKGEMFKLNIFVIKDKISIQPIFVNPSTFPDVLLHSINQV